MTVAQLTRALRWFGESFGLCQWRLLLNNDTDPPEWVDDRAGSGCCYVPSQHRRFAKIWVKPNKDISEELDTLFHELGHVLLHNAGYDDQSNRHAHCLVDDLAAMCVRAYQAGVKPRPQEEQ